MELLFFIISVLRSEFVVREVYQGESEHAVREVFYKAISPFICLMLASIFAVPRRE